MFTAPAILFLKWCLNQFLFLCPVEPSSSLIVMCTISTPDRQIIYTFQSSILISVSFLLGSGGRNYGITLCHCHQSPLHLINLNTSSETTSWIENLVSHTNTHTLLIPFVVPYTFIFIFMTILFCSYYVVCSFIHDYFVFLLWIGEINFINPSGFSKSHLHSQTNLISVFF